MSTFTGARQNVSHGCLPLLDGGGGGGGKKGTVSSVLELKYIEET